MKLKVKNLLAVVAFAAVLFTGCKKDTFTEIDSICPLVLRTDPANGATGVPLDQIITATFNENMDPATINEVSFTVMGSVVKGTVSCSDSTAVFIPDQPLMANHTYTGKISTAVKDFMGNALQRDYIWTFSTGVVLAPMVISTDPYNMETGVRLDKVISATFTVPMNNLTMNDSNFILMQGTNRISGNVTYHDSTIYFVPNSALLPNLVYNATIKKNVKDLAGTTLDTDYNWSFTTLLVTPPVIVTTDPMNNEVGVVLNKVISATFNMPMDPQSLTGSTFTLKQGSTNIPGTISYAGNTVYLNPNSNLLPGLVYSATITTNARNLAGIFMSANYTWTFTTGVLLAPTVLSTDPSNLQTAVVLDKTITATFSEDMNPLTLNNATFTLMQGLTPIAGTVSYSGRTASFNPTNPLMQGTTYTATITKGAKNLVGTSMANNYVWSFTTLTNLMVVSTDPLNSETGVAINKEISASFNFNMDPITINSLNFTLKEGSNLISGTYRTIGKTIYFSPSINLKAGTQYTATITTGAKSTTGISLLNNHSWVFTTGIVQAPTVIVTDPLNNATGVALNKVVSATFSELMNPLTINTSTFTLKNGSSIISGTVSYSGKIAYFKPNTSLVSNTTYTATITTGAKSPSGIALASDYVWQFSTRSPLGPIAPNLRSVSRFGIIAGTAVSNNAGFSKINNMDVGIYPGTRSSLTGFPPAVVVNGAIYASDDVAPPGVAAMLLQAKNDLTTAYLYCEGASAPAPATISGDQGGKTLAPGIYKSTSTLLIQSGDLTLDAQGDINAVWIFQISAAFTTIGGAGGNVILKGGASAKNIYWQVGSSATIGGYTKFNGSILALTSITMGPYATATGRMLARNAAVTMTSTNIINKP